MPLVNNDFLAYSEPSLSSMPFLALSSPASPLLIPREKYRDCTHPRKSKNDENCHYFNDDYFKLSLKFPNAFFVSCGGHFYV